jgi:regulator of RNase E activity RraA
MSCSRSLADEEHSASSATFKVILRGLSSILVRVYDLIIADRRGVVVIRL